MKDIDKELYEKMNLYDKIIGSCMVNTYSTSKDGKIILRDFNKNLDMYMFEFEVAKMVQSMYSDRQIYMDMGLFEYLVFKFKHRKECKLKRIKRKDTDNCELNIEDMLLFVAEAYGFNVDNFSDLYKIFIIYIGKKEVKLMLKIYTDGSCKGNGTKDAVGAWAYIVLNNKEEILFNNHNAECRTTNNRMEMTAVLEGIKDALDYLEDLEVNELPEIEIYTDSAYIHNCLKQKWYENWQKNGWVNSSKQPVKNRDLWELLIPYFENSKFSFHKVKGHADNEWNNYVDELAQGAADKLKGGIG